MMARYLSASIHDIKTSLSLHRDVKLHNAADNLEKKRQIFGSELIRMLAENYKQTPKIDKIK